VATVRAFGREETQDARVRAAADHALAGALRVARLDALFAPTVRLLPALGQAIVVVYGGAMAIAGKLSVVDFAVFYTYLVTLVPSIQMTGQLLGRAQDAAAAAGRIRDLLATPHQTGGHAPLPAGRLGLRVRGARVAGDGERTIVDGAELDVAPGATVGVLGATGSGKSTLLGLVNRLVEADRGEVRLGGMPVEAVELPSLRAAVALAGDDTFLFAGTIAENIAYARPEAGAAEIEAAARRAQAHDFIAALPDGYATRVGDRGTGLSGGQRQRVAIARALLAGPRLLVLDNATGNLDTLTEEAVVERLGADGEAPTRLIVAYRPSVLRLADEIVVLDGGCVVERGTHAELAARSARYRDLVGLA